MSRGNILSMIPDPHGGLTVVFECHGGENRMYYYKPPDSLAILGGADPAQFAGERDGGPGAAGIVEDIAVDIGEAAIDIGEIGLL